MTTFNSFEQTKAWCHTQCPKVALPRGSRSSLQRSERSRETCTECESSSPHGQWCSRNFEVHGRLFCVLTGDCTGRSKSPEIFFFQHVKTGHFGVAFTKIVPSNAHWTEERRECQQVLPEGAHLHSPLGHLQGSEYCERLLFLNLWRQCTYYK